MLSELHNTIPLSIIVTDGDHYCMSQIPPFCTRLWTGLSAVQYFYAYTVLFCRYFTGMRQCICGTCNIIDRESDKLEIRMQDSTQNH